MCWSPQVAGGFAFAETLILIYLYRRNWLFDRSNVYFQIPLVLQEILQALLWPFVERTRMGNYWWEATWEDPALHRCSYANSVLSWLIAVVVNGTMVVWQMHINWEHQNHDKQLQSGTAPDWLVRVGPLNDSKRVGQYGRSRRAALQLVLRCWGVFVIFLGYFLLIDNPNLMRRVVDTSSELTSNSRSGVDLAAAVPSPTAAGAPSAPNGVLLGSSAGHIDQADGISAVVPGGAPVDLSAAALSEVLMTSGGEGLWVARCTSRGPFGHQVWSMVAWPYKVIELFFCTAYTAMAGAFNILTRPSLIPYAFQHINTYCFFVYLLLGAEAGSVWCWWASCLCLVYLVEPYLLKYGNCLDCAYLDRSPEAQKWRTTDWRETWQQTQSEADRQNVLKRQVFGWVWDRFDDLGLSPWREEQKRGDVGSADVLRNLEKENLSLLGKDGVSDMTHVKNKVDSSADAGGARQHTTAAGETELRNKQELDSVNQIKNSV
ncbi:unnamed protein product [Amoebophrya sp. A120]|nr:unnamed protein product [Amoebophrya sp. A120]|eukprot:GSA120T00002312001.1